jgi:hypothetical protein
LSVGAQRGGAHEAAAPSVAVLLDNVFGGPFDRFQRAGDQVPAARNEEQRLADAGLAQVRRERPVEEELEASGKPPAKREMSGQPLAHATIADGHANAVAEMVLGVSRQKDAMPPALEPWITLPMRAGRCHRVFLRVRGKRRVRGTANFSTDSQAIGETARRFFTIRDMKPCAKGPGLAKTRGVPLYRTRTVQLVSGCDARWQALFDSADVVSEGSPRGEDPHREYFGSTDIVLLVAPERPGVGLQEIADLMARDPHVRVRALRMARREAAQRAMGPLDRMWSEISVKPSDRGVSVHVEVQAPVFPDRRSMPREAAAVADPT